MKLVTKLLESGAWHIRAAGPCNWAQPATWPCDDAELERSTFPEASAEFRAALRRMRDELTGQW
jgi:hypothetical protein